MTLLFIQSDIFNHWGFWLLVAGLFIRYQIGRRKFNRKNFAGLQLYRSYFMGLVISVLEYLFKLIGLLLIVAGAIDVLINHWS